MAKNKTPKAKASTLTIRLNAKQNSDLRKVKEILHQTTSSGTIARLIPEFLELYSKNDSLQRSHDDLLSEWSARTEWLQKFQEQIRFIVKHDF